MAPNVAFLPAKPDEAVKCVLQPDQNSTCANELQGKDIVKCARLRMLDPQPKPAFENALCYPSHHDLDAQAARVPGAAALLGLWPSRLDGQFDVFPQSDVVDTVVAQPFLPAAVAAGLLAQRLGAVLLVIGVVRLRHEPLPATAARPFANALFPLGLLHGSPPCREAARKQPASQTLWLRREDRAGQTACVTAQAKGELATI